MVGGDGAGSAGGGGGLTGVACLSLSDSPPPTAPPHPTQLVAFNPPHPPPVTAATVRCPRAFSCPSSPPPMRPPPTPYPAHPPRGRGGEGALSGQPYARAPVWGRGGEGRGRASGVSGREARGLTSSANACPVRDAHGRIDVRQPPAGDRATPPDAFFGPRRRVESAGSEHRKRAHIGCALRCRCESSNSRQ